MIKYLDKKGRIYFAIEIILLILDAVLEVGLAYIMLLCIELAQSTNLANILHYLIYFIIYISIFFLVDFYYKKLKWYIIKMAKINLRNHLFENIFLYEVNDFHKKNTGEWISILTNDLDIIEDSYFKSIFQLIFDSFEFIISLILIFLISPIMATFVLLVVCFQFLIPKYFAPRLSQSKDDFSLELERFTKNLSENLNAFELIKEFNVFHNILENLRGSNINLGEKQYNTRTLSTLSGIASFTLGQIQYIGIYYIGSILVVLNKITIPTLIAASQLIVYIASPLISLSSTITEIKSANLIIDKLTNIAVNKNKKPSEEINKCNFQNCLSMEQVNFGYDNELILKDINLNLLKGKKYLIVGQSGSGKSTLIKLISRQLKLQIGNISLDGTDIYNIPAKNYSKIISVNSQDIFIFNASLKENITLFEDDYKDSEILDAIKFVELSKVLSDNNWNLDTIINQNGENFSGGELQRIALARVILRKHPIMILDESFTNIDITIANKILFKLLDDKDLTIIYITHQISKELKNRFDETISIINKSIKTQSIH